MTLINQRKYQTQGFSQYTKFRMLECMKDLEKAGIGIDKLGKKEGAVRRDSEHISSWNKLSLKERVRRSAVSREKNVETLVVADHKMVEYHGKNVIQAYVLSIMNIVSTLYLLIACIF